MELHSTYYGCDLYRERAGDSYRWSANVLGFQVHGASLDEVKTEVREELHRTRIAPAVDEPAKAHHGAWTIMKLNQPPGRRRRTQRKATLEDVADDCALCRVLRRQILAGNPPTLIAYE